MAHGAVKEGIRLVSDSRSNRWRPPGYEALVGKIIEAHAQGKKGRFAVITGLTIDEVNRWVGGLPGNHESLLRWADALGLPWQTIVTAEDDSAAAKATPRIVPRAPPVGIKHAARTRATSARRR